MEDKKYGTGACCMLWFLAGVVMGGGIVLLTAPQSGERTRRQLKRLAEDAKEKIEDCLDEIKDKAAHVMDKA